MQLSASRTTPLGDGPFVRRDHATTLVDTSSATPATRVSPQWPYRANATTRQIGIAQQEKELDQPSDARGLVPSTHSALHVGHYALLERKC
jgi:hypothetical protein